MKVLVATRETSDPTKGDFAYASDGELVFKAETCASDDHPLKCKCSRALAGTRTRLFTNTVRVADKEYFKDETDAIHPSIEGLRAEAEKYEPGSILEVTPDGLLLRKGEHIWQEWFSDDV